MDWSIAYWIAPLDQQDHLGTVTGWYAAGRQFVDITNSRMWGQMGAGNFYSTATYTVGSWVHVVYTYNQTYEKWYLNGTFSNQNANNLAEWNGVFFLGQYGYQTNYYEYKGAIDEFRIYSRALTDADVAELFAYDPTPEPSEITGEDALAVGFIFGIMALAIALAAFVKKRR